MGSTKNKCNELESEVDLLKKNLANTEDGLDEIHKSWQDQHKEIDKQKKIIDTLRSEQIKEKAERYAELRDKENNYQKLTKALANATDMLKEEREARRELMNTFSNEKDAHRETRKQLKGIWKSATVKLKAENDFD